MGRANEEVAAAFERESKLLAIQRANPFRVRAYRNAAESIRRLGQPLEDMIAAGHDLSELPAIGKDLAHQIEEIVRTGTSEKLSETARQTPVSLIEIFDVPGIGPARTNTLFRELGVRNLQDLVKALMTDRVEHLPGFGPSMVRRMRSELGVATRGERRMLLSEAEAAAAPLVAYLDRCDAIDEATVCGSLRRCKPTIGDLDVVVCAQDTARAMQQVLACPRIESAVAAGETRAMLRITGNVGVDVRVVERESYGAALVYFTGNKSHNIALRRLARKQGMKLNEYGLFRDDERIAGRTEQDVYAALGLAFLPPELRHGSGEIALAAEHRVPRLIELRDVLGDLHVPLPDTLAGVRAFLETARKAGHRYIGFVASHRSRLGDVSDKAVLARISRLRKDIGTVPRLRVLFGIEVEVAQDGSLASDEEFCRQFDYVVAVVRTHRNLARSRQTTRVCQAVANPRVRVLSHPLGRETTGFPGLQLDMHAVARAAAARGCLLELNGDPARLDLPDEVCRELLPYGVKFCIGGDAVSDADFARNLRYAVSIARRAALPRESVVNTLGVRDIVRRLTTPPNDKR